MCLFYEYLVSRSKFLGLWWLYAPKTIGSIQSGVVDWIKINDNLSLLRFELPVGQEIRTEK